MPHENETSFVARTGRTLSGYLPSMDGVRKWGSDFRKTVSAYFAEDNKLERFLIALTDFGLPIISGVIITSLAEQEDQTPEEREQHSVINAKMGVAIMTPILVSGLRALANKHLSYSMGNKISKDMVNGYLQDSTMTLKDHYHRQENQQTVSVTDTLAKYTGEFSTNTTMLTAHLGHCALEVTVNFVAASVLMKSTTQPLVAFGGAVLFASVIGPVKSYSSEYEAHLNRCNDSLRKELEDMERNREQIVLLGGQKVVKDKIISLIDAREHYQNRVAQLLGATVFLEGAAFWVYPIFIRSMGPLLYTESQRARPGNIDLFSLQTNFALARMRDITDAIGKKALFTQSMDKVVATREDIEGSHLFQNDTSPLLKLSYDSQGETIQFYYFTLAKPRKKDNTTSPAASPVPLRKENSEGDIEMGIVEKDTAPLLTTHVQRVLSDEKIETSLKSRVENAFRDDELCMVREAHLSLEAGKIYQLEGKSGLGKSSLFKSMKKNWPYAGGEVRFPCKEEEVYCIPQITYIAPTTPLLDVLIFPRKPETLTSGERVKLEGFLHKLNMGEFVAVLAKEENQDPLKDKQTDWSTALSGGQRKWVALIRALMVVPQPKVLLMDEITTGIDQESKGATLEFIKETCKGITILYIEHYELPGFKDHTITIDKDSKQLMLDGMVQQPSSYRAQVMGQQRGKAEQTYNAK